LNSAKFDGRTHIASQVFRWKIRLREYLREIVVIRGYPDFSSVFIGKGMAAPEEPAEIDGIPALTLRCIYHCAQRMGAAREAGLCAAFWPPAMT
jgi:hypothetical protein